MYLGIDLGTSGVKALLIDEAQNVISAASASLQVSHPFDGGSEQNPQDWIDATRAAIAKLTYNSDANLGLVRGIGLSGQMHGATVLDRTGAPLRPAILWNDIRSYAQARKLDENPVFREITGNIVFPGFTAPKLLWLKTHEPELFQKIAMVLLPKDYLRLWLTGECVSDMSDASGTSWLDVGQRKWSEPLLSACHLSTDQMPSLVEGTEVSGFLRGSIATELGLPAGIPVAGGAGDNAASAVGLGTTASGHGFASLGTSGVVFAANDQFSPAPESAVHAFCHALPNLWHQMGVVLSAGDSLSWLSKALGTNTAVLLDELGRNLAPPSKTMFLPYLSGERTPHNDAEIRGAFLGLSQMSTPLDMTQAVLEGVAFAFRDSVEALKQTGTQLENLSVVGGGSKSNYWVELLATVLNQPCNLHAESEIGAALGAARLGMIAAENADPLDVCKPPPVVRQIIPNASLHAAFNETYQLYRNTYPALKGIK